MFKAAEAFAVNEVFSVEVTLSARNVCNIRTGHPGRFWCLHPCRLQKSQLDKAVADLV